MSRTLLEGQWGFGQGFTEELRRRLPVGVQVVVCPGTVVHQELRPGACVQSVFVLTVGKYLTWH